VVQPSKYNSHSKRAGGIIPNITDACAVSIMETGMIAASKPLFGKKPISCALVLNLQTRKRLEK
jgi:hypothetical protein